MPDWLPRSVMPALHRQLPKIKAERKLQALRAARALRAGGLLAHNTSTLPGIAASPFSHRAVSQMCRFKQRSGPFLLLASSRNIASGLARHLTPELRQAMKRYWPGHTTLIFPARPGLPGSCYEGGQVAVRVDASDEVRRLARACGGLILSSSLNRRGKANLTADRRLRMRLKRHVRICLAGGVTTGRPSTLLRVGRHIKPQR